MKKKIVAIVLVALMIAAIMSLTACNSKTMFDGNYSKAATKEQAQTAWNSARDSMNNNSELAKASADSQDAAIAGWKGMKLQLDSSNSMITVEDGVTNKIEALSQSKGALLFDESAMSITGKSELSMIEGEDSKSLRLNAGMYIKDKNLYTDINLGDSSLKVKFAPPTSESNILNSTAIKNAMSQITQTFADGAVQAIGAAIGDLPYEDMLMKYGQFQAYINDSGKYSRVKFTFSAQMIADIYAEEFGIEDDFVNNAVLSDCSIIIVNDKETGAFQGAKLSVGFSYTHSEEGLEVSVQVNNTASVENCDEMKSSYPSDLDKYTDVENLTLKEVRTFLEAIFDFI